MKTYDEIVKALHRRNDNLIYNFRGWLKRSGLGEGTIDKHVNNISFFLNEYLTYQDISENDQEITLCNAEDGIALVDDFLGYWFIIKKSTHSLLPLRFYQSRCWSLAQW